MERWLRHQKDPAAQRVPSATDEPYAETREVLAGYTIVECDRFDGPPTSLRSGVTPAPKDTLSHDWCVDRPIADYSTELEV